MSTLHSIRDIVSLWQSRSEFVSGLMAVGAADVSLAQVNKWVQRDAIPCAYHAALIEAASREGHAVNAEILVSIHDTRRKAEVSA